MPSHDKFRSNATSIYAKNPEKPVHREGIAWQGSARTVQAAEIMHLQRVAGNHKAQHLLQTKLKLGAANSLYEREADQMAAQVIPSTVQRSRQQSEGMRITPAGCRATG